MSNPNRLGRHQRRILQAMRRGIPLVNEDGQWSLVRDGRWKECVPSLSAQSLFFRGYTMWDERAGHYVITEKGKGKS